MCERANACVCCGGVWVGGGEGGAMGKVERDGYVSIACAVQCWTVMCCAVRLLALVLLQ
jgi:hypothetical protein